MLQDLLDRARFDHRALGQDHRRLGDAAYQSGLPLARSEGFPPNRVEQLSAVTAGLASLTQGATRMFDGGSVTQTVVEMQRGLLIVMAISDGSSLAVLAALDCDSELVAYEMTLLVDQVGSALTPKMRGTQSPG